MTRLLALALAYASLSAAEPAPRALSAAPIKMASPLAHISAAQELASGKILISDARTPLVALLDPATGALTAVGAAGAGADHYAQPGGFYGGPNGNTLLLDRSEPRALVIGPDARIMSSYSVAQRGVSGSSDADIDRVHLDARGFVYLVDRNAAMIARMRSGNSGTDRSADIVRLDPVQQSKVIVATLLQQSEIVTSSGNGMTFSQMIAGSPADGWGVMPDGRVAIVRATPYRVDWVSPDGKISKGPAIDYTPIPLTDQDKQAITRAAGKAPSVGVGGADGGTPTTSADMERKFAATKPPFAPDDVVVSPAGRVWVMRSQPFGANSSLYDVFDTNGARIDRVQFPVNSRVIGFGPGSVFVREGLETNAPLKKYKVS